MLLRRGFNVDTERERQIDTDLLVQVGDNSQNYTQQNNVYEKVPIGPHLEGKPKNSLFGSCILIAQTKGEKNRKS